MALELIEVYHPILDRTEMVPIQSLEHLFRSGWIRASDRPTTEEPVKQWEAPKEIEAVEEDEEE